MTDSPKTLKARRTWVETYRKTGNAGLTCRRCGISRPTLRKWVRRFAADGEAGLHSKSRRPHALAESKRTPLLTDRVLSLRRERNLGSTRMQAELLRLDGTWLSTSTIHRVLADAGVKPIKRPKRPKKPTRYSRPSAGDRVQIDTMKVAKGLIQFTAIDPPRRGGRVALGCESSRSTRTRRALRQPTSSRSASSQASRSPSSESRATPPPSVVDGSEFISHEFLDVLRKHRVKLRPNRARAPHLNGKVERSQQTDLVEFYALEIDGKGRHRRAKAPDEIVGRLAEWERFYNEVRPHSGIGRKPPQKRWEEVAELTPTREELDARYDPKSEPRTVKRGNWYYVQK